MTLSGLTPTQRRIITLLLIAVIVAFSMLAGFIVTSLQIQHLPLPTATRTPTVIPSRTPTATATPALSPPDAGIWPQIRAARLFDQIARQVETVRGLAPRAEIPLSFLTEQELLTLRQRSAADQPPPVPLLPYVRLGLLPDRTPTVRPRPVVGMYLPEQEQLYVGLNVNANDADDRAVLAHAYLHALQDRYFDLQALDARATTDDERLAVHALIEGDALLATALYTYEDLTSADWNRLTALIVRAEQLDYGPRFDATATWPLLQSFPYREGRHLALTLFNTGGWTAINNAYSAPPRSTEQILHPERYRGAVPDPPTEVIVPSLAPVLGADWDLLTQDTLGEFTVGLYLADTLPAETAWAAADGWDGDTFVVWENATGAEPRDLFVWRTVWDTIAEAEEFNRALENLIRERYRPVRPLPPPGETGGRRWEWAGGALYLSRIGRHVTYVSAPTASLLTAVVKELP